MASEVDVDTKQPAHIWLAGDPWFEGLLKDTMDAYREGYRQAYDAGARRFGLATPTQAGPQMRGEQ